MFLNRIISLIYRPHPSSCCSWSGLTLDAPLKMTNSKQMQSVHYYLFLQSPLTQQITINIEKFVPEGKLIKNCLTLWLPGEKRSRSCQYVIYCPMSEVLDIQITWAEHFNFPVEVVVTISILCELSGLSGVKLQTGVFTTLLHLHPPHYPLTILSLITPQPSVSNSSRRPRNNMWAYSIL